MQLALVSILCSSVFLLKKKGCEEETVYAHGPDCCIVVINSVKNQHFEHSLKCDITTTLTGLIQMAQKETDGIFFCVTAWQQELQMPSQMMENWLLQTEMQWNYMGVYCVSAVV